MNYFKYIIIMAGLLSWFSSCKNEDVKSEDDKFKVGQVWKYKTRAGEENSTLTILKVEKYDSLGVVIHIYVDGLKVKNARRPNGISEEVGHLPISKEAVLKSVTSLVKENAKLPDFMEGYTTWKQAFDNKKAGIFTIEVSETIKFLEEAMGNGKQVEE